MSYSAVVRPLLAYSAALRRNRSGDRVWIPGYCFKQKSSGFTTARRAALSCVAPCPTNLSPSRQRAPTAREIKARPHTRCRKAGDDSASAFNSSRQVAVAVERCRCIMYWSRPWARNSHGLQLIFAVLVMFSLIRTALFELVKS
jgi:hypothetical protein